MSQQASPSGRYVFDSVQREKICVLHKYLIQLVVCTELFLTDCTELQSSCPSQMYYHATP